MLVFLFWLHSVRSFNIFSLDLHAQRLAYIQYIYRMKYLVHQGCIYLFLYFKMSFFPVIAIIYIFAAIKSVQEFDK